MSVADSAGMLLTIPAGSVADEQTISLAHELLPDAKRLGRDYEVSEMSCHLMPDGLTFQVTPTITMPAADGTSRLVRWNEDRLEWNELDASPSAGELTADISELGEYAVSRPSRPLGVWGITAEPNPFSPDEGPVEISFDVSSIDVRSPFVTLRVRNVQGQIVRTIVENEPAPKGEVVVEWDGLSDDGAEARNGRYIIEVIAEDAGSEETSLGTVVLIK